MRTCHWKGFLLLICCLLFFSAGCGYDGSASALPDEGDPQDDGSPPPFNSYIGTPPAPVITTATATATSVYLDWTDESPKEDGFYVFRDKVRIGETDHNISEWTDTLVSPATTYVYAVIAFNREGSNVSPEITVTTPPIPSPLIQPPAFPQNLFAAANSTSITLSWTDASNNEDGFKILRDGVIVQTTAANVASWNDTNILPGMTYCYTVIAFNSGGDSGLSNQACGTVPVPVSRPVAPQNLTAQADYTSITLSWTDASNNEDGFRIYRDGAVIQTVAANTTAWKDTGVVAGATYSYRVLSFNKAGESDSPNVVVATVPVPVSRPVAPQNLTAQADYTSITLSWTDASNNEDGFKILRDGVIVQTTAANVASWNDTNILPGMTYCYTVIAFNSGGDSGLSNQACGTVPLPNAIPWVDIKHPANTDEGGDGLVYKATRIYVRWIDADDQYLDLRILLNNQEIYNVEVQASFMESGQYFDIDLADLPEGEHVITAEVYDSREANASYDFRIRINQAETEDEAMQFLYFHSASYEITDTSGTYKYLVRWASLPIAIEISPLFTQEQFQMIADAAAFLSKYTGIAFEMRWSAMETLGPEPSCLPPDMNFIFIYPETYPDNSLARAITCTKGYLIPDRFTTQNGIIMVQKDALITWKDALPWLLAHEIGHILPITAHESTYYLMYRYVGSYFIVSPEMMRAMEKLYSEHQIGDIIYKPSQFTIGYIPNSW